MNINTPLYFQYSLFKQGLPNSQIKTVLDERLNLIPFMLTFSRHYNVEFRLEISSAQIPYDIITFKHDRMRLIITPAYISLNGYIVLSSPHVVNVLNEGLSGFPYKYKLSSNAIDSTAILVSNDNTLQTYGYILIKQSVFSEALFLEDTCQRIS